MSAKPVLKIGHLKITDHLILGITKAKLLKEVEKFEHCDIEPIAMTGWNEIGDALQAGEIDIAFILAPYAMELFHSGEKIKMILLGHKSGSVIVSNSRLDIQKVEDFKGKTVLIPYHLSVHHMLFNKILTEKGLKTGVDGDVMFEVMAPSQIPEVMSWDEKGDIGGFIVAEPFGMQVIKQGLGKEFKLSKDIWPNHPCCVVTAKDEIIAKYPEAVAELVKSLVFSGRMIHEKVETAAKIGAQFLTQDLEIVTAVLSQSGRVSADSLLPVLTDLETIQDYMTTKISALSGKIDLEKFVDLRFAQAAGAK